MPPSTKTIGVKMIKDIVGSLTDAIRERTKSPIVGSILCSWAIINHEIIIKAVSKEVSHAKFLDYIDKAPMKDLIWYPLLAGFLFVTLTPFIDNGVQWIRRKAELRGKKNKINFDKDVAALRLDLIKQEAINEKEKNQIEKTKEDLKAQQNDIDNQKENLEKERGLLRNRDNEITDKEAVNDGRFKREQARLDELRDRVNKTQEKLDKDIEEFNRKQSERRSALQTEIDAFENDKSEFNKEIRKSKVKLDEEHTSRMTELEDNFKNRAEDLESDYSKRNEELRSKINSLDTEHNKKMNELEAIHKKRQRDLEKEKEEELLNREKELKINFKEKEEELLKEFRLKNDKRIQGVVDFKQIKIAIQNHKKWKASNGKNGEKAVFIEANLTGGEFDNKNLSEVFFQNCDLSKVSIQKVNFSKANLVGSTFQNAKMQGVIFNKSILLNTKFQGANLVEANFQNANLGYANFSCAELSKADFKQSDLREADFTDSNLSGADFWGATMIGTNLSGANLKQANITKANLKKIITDEKTIFPDGSTNLKNPSNKAMDVIPKKSENLFNENLSIDIKNLVGEKYIEPFSFDVMGKYGSPETLDGTNNFKWIAYFPKGHFTIISNKKSNTIIEVLHGRKSGKDL